MVLKRPNWNRRHPPSCTCYDCNEGRFDLEVRHAGQEAELRRRAREEARSAPTVRPVRSGRNRPQPIRRTSRNGATWGILLLFSAVLTLIIAAAAYFG